MHIDPLLHCLAGVGNRGSSAVGRLIKNGKVSGAEMWCLDHDRKVLEGSGTANVVVVRKEEPHMVCHHTLDCLPNCSGGIHVTTALAALFVPIHFWMSCWWHAYDSGGHMYISCKHVPEPKWHARPCALAYFSFKALGQGIAPTCAQVLSLAAAAALRVCE